MEKNLNPENINKLLTKLLLVDRQYGPSYNSEEYSQIILELNSYSDILSRQLSMEYSTAISATRDLYKGLDYLKELKKDEEEANILLQQINEEYKMKLSRVTMLSKEIGNLRTTQEILSYVKTNKVDKIKRVMVGNSSALNEATMDWLGKPFGELYNELKGKPTPQQILADLESAEKLQQQKMQNEGANGSTDKG